MIGNYSKETEENILNQVIFQVLQFSKIKVPKLNLLKEENIIKLKLLNMMCKTNDKTDEIQIININDINNQKELQILIYKFIGHFTKYSIKELITSVDTISNYYFTLKKVDIFRAYLKNRKKKTIPFFTMIGFIAYINLKKDISENIEKFMKNKYIKKLVDEYIEIKKGWLWRIIYLYINLVLHGYEDDDSKIIYEDMNNLTIDDLKNMVEQYMCYNDLFDEGEIVNFVNCLYSSFTNELIPIYLTQGFDKDLVNRLIKFVLKQISEKLTNKNYCNKKQINELYDCIAERIREFCDMSLNDNYPKFILKYCQYFNQGNKKIVLSFLSGLNPNNFKNTFSKINFKEIGNDDYYNNIKKYIDSISPKKNQKLEKKNNKIKQNKINLNKEKYENVNDKRINKENIYNNGDNNGDEELKNENNNSYNNIEKEKSISKEGKENELINRENDSKINDDIYSIKNNMINDELKEDYNKLKKRYDELKENYAELKQKYNNSQNEIKKLSFVNNKIMNEMVSSRLKANQIISDLKRELRNINYRDISKVIINTYLDKYYDKLVHLLNKKDKVYHILKLLNGNEYYYYKKIIDKYYESNTKSHISIVFHQIEEECFMDLKSNNSHVIQKKNDEYCSNILEEKTQIENVEKLFKIKKIINKLYQEIVVKSKYSYSKFK